MTDFQVGDRVSIEGVIERRVSVHVDQHGPEDPVWECRFQAIEHRPWVRESDLTLIERPRRKLRVGSVWERWGVLYCVGTDKDGYQHLVSLKDGGILDIRLIGVSHPDWREVPVEELAREATT